MFDGRVTCWLGWLCSLSPLVVPGCRWSELRAEGRENLCLTYVTKLTRHKACVALYVYIVYVNVRARQAEKVRVDGGDETDDRQCECVSVGKLKGEIRFYTC